MPHNRPPTPSSPRQIPSNAPRIVKAVDTLLKAGSTSVPACWVIGAWCDANCGALPGIPSCRDLAGEYAGGIDTILTPRWRGVAPITDDVSRNWVACQVTMADSASAEFKCDCRLLVDHGVGWMHVGVKD